MLFLALAMTWSWSMASAGETAPQATLPPVHVVQVEGTLDGVTARFLLDRLNSAGPEGAQAVVVTVDSAASVGVDPAPLAAAVRASRVPVVAWVGGHGAVARGAAREVVAAADVVMVAPDARIDPAVPVEAEVATVGGVVTGLDGRELRGVRLTTAETTADAEGRPLRRPAGTIRFFKPDFVARLLHAVDSPHLAVFLFLAGLTAVAFEAFTAGIGLAALTGAVCLALAFHGMAALPTRWPFVAVMAAGVVLYAVDAQQLRVRTMTAAGTVAVMAGATGAYWARPEGVRPAPWLLSLIVALTALTWVVALPVMVRARYATSLIGRDALIGRRGVAVTEVGMSGVVAVDAAQWNAAARPAPIPAGGGVEVTGVDGITLWVEAR